MRKFTNRQRGKGEEYRVGDLVLLSTKDLKWQMKGRRSEKLTEHFMGSYKVKGIVSSNVIELELPKSIKIHSVVNVSSVTNFIRPYLHQFSIDSHGLNGYGKPLKRPFDRY